VTAIGCLLRSLPITPEQSSPFYETDGWSDAQKVLAQLQAVSGINPENAVKAIQKELAVIEAGLEELKPPPGSLPENERN
jgi:hypothetical protein